jgi:hypothetical protein
LRIDWHCRADRQFGQPFQSQDADAELLKDALAIKRAITKNESRGKRSKLTFRLTGVQV